MTAHSKHLLEKQVVKVTNPRPIPLVRNNVALRKLEVALVAIVFIANHRCQYGLVLKGIP